MRRRRRRFGMCKDRSPFTPPTRIETQCRLAQRELHPRDRLSSVGFQDREGSMAAVLRKEVIQPQVPLRLPCYDFTPVADLTVDGCILAVCAPA